MEGTHGTLPHLGPEGTCITSIHIPLAISVTWPIPLQRTLGNSEELTGTDKHRGHRHSHHLPHLTVEETEAQRNGDMAQDLAASVGGKPIQVQVYLPARPPS